MCLGGIEKPEIRHMTANCLDIITQITVELHKDDASKEKLGSGVLYYNENDNAKVYQQIIQ